MDLSTQPADPFLQEKRISPGKRNSWSAKGKRKMGVLWPQGAPLVPHVEPWGFSQSGRNPVVGAHLFRKNMFKQIHVNNFIEKMRLMGATPTAEFAS